MPPNKKKRGPKKGKRTGKKDGTIQGSASCARRDGDDFDAEAICLQITDLVEEVRGANFSDKSDEDFSQDGDCPICLEPLAPVWDVERSARLICCGGRTCRKCCVDTIAAIDKSYEDPKAAFQLDDRCVLCKQDVGTSVITDRILSPHIRNGKIWAIAHVAQILILRRWDEREDPLFKNGLELLTVAAEGGHPISQYLMGLILIRSAHSSREARDWMEKSANQGHVIAQATLGSMLVKLSNEEEGANEEGGKWWYLKAAQQGDADSQLQLGLEIIKDGPTSLEIPFGVNLIRNAASCGYTKASEVMEILSENHPVSENCWFCLEKFDEQSQTRMRCTKCKVACYCSRECQKLDWRERHRDACKLQEMEMAKIPKEASFMSNMQNDNVEQQYVNILAQVV